MADIIVLNEITELLNDVNSELSTNISNVKTDVAGIKSVVDTISTNVNSIKTETAKNNTESSTGTLSQKLTYILNRRDRIAQASNTNIVTLTSSLSTSKTTKNQTVSTGSGSPYKAYSNYTSSKMVCYMGNYRFSCTATMTISVATVNGAHVSSDDITNKCYFEVYVDNVLKLEKLMISVKQYGGTDQTTAAVTTTTDLYLTSGQLVKCRLRVESPCAFVTCYGNNYSDEVSATASDISIKATAKEKTALIV